MIYASDDEISELVESKLIIVISEHKEKKTMALSNCTPEIWSQKLLAIFDKRVVRANLVNRDFEGDITAAGRAGGLLSQLGRHAERLRRRR